MSPDPIQRISEIIDHFKQSGLLSAGLFLNSLFYDALRKSFDWVLLTFSQHKWPSFLGHQVDSDFSLTANLCGITIFALFCLLQNT